MEKPMFSNLFSKIHIIDLKPEQVFDGLRADQMVLIDVREPSEYGLEHIEGAVNIPLARLTTASLPDAKGRTIVLQCQAGGRSSQGVKACSDHGLGISHHLQGGIGAWKAQGLPTIRKG